MRSPLNGCFTKRGSRRQKTITCRVVGSNTRRATPQNSTRSGICRLKNRRRIAALAAAKPTRTGSSARSHNKNPTRRDVGSHKNHPLCCGTRRNKYRQTYATLAAKTRRSAQPYIHPLHLLWPSPSPHELARPLRRPLVWRLHLSRMVQDCCFKPLPYPRFTGLSLGSSLSPHRSGQSSSLKP